MGAPPTDRHLNHHHPSPDPHAHGASDIRDAGTSAGVGAVHSSKLAVPGNSLALSK